MDSKNMTDDQLKDEINRLDAAIRRTKSNCLRRDYGKRLVALRLEFARRRENTTAKRT